jgi:hypothetical protein
MGSFQLHTTIHQDLGYVKQNGGDTCEREELTYGAYNKCYTVAPEHDSPRHHDISSKNR